MKKYLYFLIFLSTFYFLLSTASSTQAAATCPPNSPGVCITIDGVLAQLEYLACWFGSIAFTLAVIMLIVYGLMFMASQGDPAKFSGAKEAFKWGIIGAFVIIGSYVIIVSVAAFVGNTAFQLPFTCR